MHGPLLTCVVEYCIRNDLNIAVQLHMLPRLIERTRRLHRGHIRHGSSTAVHRGTAFEERSLTFLQENLSMSLRRVGGKEDGGIDLQGWWWLPPLSQLPPISDPGASNQAVTRRRLRVIAQCKAEKKKTSPKYVRELEGVMLRFLAFSTPSPNPLSSSSSHPNRIMEEDLSSSAAQYPLVALLVSESPFTRSTLLRAHSSPLPLFLLQIPPAPEPSLRFPQGCESSTVIDTPSTTRAQSTNMGAAFWNPALAKDTLGGDVEIRWERCDGVNDGRPAIWWRNRRLESWVPGNATTHMHT